MADFVMPSLGADMEAGTLVAWHKNAGQAVRRGDIIAEVETDKGIIDIEVFTSGILEQILVPVGEKVPVGTLLARIREEGQTAEEKVAAPAISVDREPPKAPAALPAVAAEKIAGPAASSTSGDVTRLPMSPSARRLARELGVDPHTVTGTGPGGAITREDIQRAAAASTAKTPPSVSQPSVPKPQPPSADQASRMRAAIAAAMARSKREIPHYYLQTTIDFHAAETWLAEENLKRPMTERLLYGVLLLKAVALALQEVPDLNAVWEGDRVQVKEAVHLGVAISVRGGGLIAPALHNATEKNIDQLMREFRDLVRRARSGGLRSSELTDPTITVTSLGEQGVEAVYGIIYPPQVALVGFGKIVTRPWSVNNAIVPRSVITATLSADHRVSDGHRGGLFLSAVDRLLQEPDKL
ncbi:MAG TPA: dihydrolipoamide acetyltransferase family protein [Planctomycetaceae bacterium]|nr:dihydrolipoamide acetyltransferase family protein [Planctomycetaceae bacterium]